jgi:hypothetical protein
LPLLDGLDFFQIKFHIPLRQLKWHDQEFVRTIPNFHGWFFHIHIHDFKSTQLK